MKKYVGTFIASVALLTALPIAANAADGNTDTQKTTQAEIELTQGDKKDITLDTVPGVKFGSNESKNETVTYPAKTVSDHVQVTNPGNAEGWDVQVSGTAFKEGNKEIKGAKLKFANGKVTPNDGANESDLPTTKDTTITPDAQSILTAGAGAGVGAFTLTHTATSVSLYVPAGNIAGNYSSTLTWKLVNAPTGAITTPSK